MEWKPIIGNIFGTVAAAGAASQIPVPPQYQWAVMLGAAILANLAGLFQQKPRRKKDLTIK